MKYLTRYHGTYSRRSGARRLAQNERYAWTVVLLITGLLAGMQVTLVVCRLLW